MNDTPLSEPGYWAGDGPDDSARSDQTEEPPGLDTDYVQQPIPDGEPVVTAPVITGGEGFGVVRRRHLLVLVALPDRSDIPKSISNQLLDSDIREAMAKAARKLHDTAMKYTVTGYTWDLDDIVYDMPRARTLSATLVIERE